MSITLEHVGMASIVTFEKPPLNLLDIETMDRLIAVHQEADANPDTRVIVTRSGLKDIFCNGLNPKFVLGTPVEKRDLIFNAVGRLLHHLLFLKKPQIAVLNGPTMAGGAILGITADFRYMHRERGRFCFAEAKVGLPVPGSVIGALQLFCKPAAVREVVMLGKNMDAQYAFDAGLVDGLADSEEGLDEMVKTQIARLSRLSPEVLATTKRALREHLYEVTKEFMEHPGEFIRFCGPDFLGEGLDALVSGRHPVFRK